MYQKSYYLKIYSLHVFNYVILLTYIKYIEVYTFTENYMVFFKFLCSKSLRFSNLLNLNKNGCNI